MSRSVVSLRAAEIDDADFLAGLWASGMRKADHQDLVADVELIIKAAAASSEQRLVVADYDGAPAGAVLLKVSTLSPINLEPAVQAVSPHVLEGCRRHGVGRALMESAVTFAEDNGIAHVTTAALSGARDANRFMARLAFGPHATLRFATTAVVRARLTAQMPVPSGGRQRHRVLAARRSLRRSQASGMAAATAADGAPSTGTPVAPPAPLT